MSAKYSCPYRLALPHMSIEVAKEEDLVGLGDPPNYLVQQLNLSSLCWMVALGHTH